MQLTTLRTTISVSKMFITDKEAPKPPLTTVTMPIQIHVCHYCGNIPAEERSRTQSLKLAKSNHFLIESYKDSSLEKPEVEGEKPVDESS